MSLLTSSIDSGHAKLKVAIESDTPTSCQRNGSEKKYSLTSSIISSKNVITDSVEILLGFSMKGIRALGKCPKCRGAFRWNEKKGFICFTCLTHPRRFLIDFFFKGERIRRATTFDGKTLSSFAEAHALLNQAQNEIRTFRFDPTRWKSKDRLEFRFSYLIDKWYREKEDLMKKGRLAPSYIPSLFSYVKCHYVPFFRDTDVREILNTLIKEFVKQIPSTLSLHYQKNLLDALRNFFRWLKDDRLIEDVPSFPKIEVPEYNTRVLMPDTQRKIFELIPERHRPIFVYLFNQGCRPSEARALKWKDIENDIVTYRRTWSGSALREVTKTKRIRCNLLFTETLAILPKRRFPEDFVFTHGKANRPYSHYLLHELFMSAVKKLGFKITLYEATKHSFGSYYVNEKKIGRDLLKEWFGHTDIKMTERYTKIKIVDAFRDLLEKEKKVRNFGDR